MNSLRGLLITKDGDRRTYQCHIDNGSGKPLCNDSGRAFRENRIRCWLHVADQPNCNHCLKKFQKLTNKEKSNAT